MSAPITKREPAVIVGAISALGIAIIGVGIAFGLQLSEAQVDALTGLFAPAVLTPIVAALITRGLVTSPATAERKEQEAYEAGVADAEADAAEPAVEEDSEEEYRPKRALVEPVDPSLA